MDHRRPRRHPEVEELIGKPWADLRYELKKLFVQEDDTVYLRWVADEHLRTVRFFRKKPQVPKPKEVYGDVVWPEWADDAFKKAWARFKDYKRREFGFVFKSAQTENLVLQQYTKNGVKDSKTAIIILEHTEGSTWKAPVWEKHADLIGAPPVAQVLPPAKGFQTLVRS